MDLDAGRGLTGRILDSLHASFETTERFYMLIQEEEAAEEAASMLRPLGLATPLRPERKEAGER